MVNMRTICNKMPWCTTPICYSAPLVEVGTELVREWQSYTAVVSIQFIWIWLVMGHSTRFGGGGRCIWLTEHASLLAFNQSTPLLHQQFFRGFNPQPSVGKGHTVTTNDMVKNTAQCIILGFVLPSGGVHTGEEGSAISRATSIPRCSGFGPSLTISRRQKALT